jgi:hypothetical protein
MPRLTLRRPRREYFPSPQHPRGPKNTRGFNRTRACTQPTRPCSLYETEPARAGLRTVYAMLNAGWPALLAALSFVLTTNLSDAIFGNLHGALQTLARAAGCLRVALPTRDAFLTALAKAALRHCISTLGQFGRQADTNIALTAAQSLPGRLVRDTDEAARDGS